MNCPNCNTNITNHIETCPGCGFKLNYSKWVVIAKEYPPNDMVIESLLKSSGIPVKTTKKEVSGFPVAIGPLAEVKILVPDNYLNDAKIIINDFSDESETTPHWET